jgi:hypothetical protein
MEAQISVGIGIDVADGGNHFLVSGTDCRDVFVRAACGGTRGSLRLQRQPQILDGAHDFHRRSGLVVPDHDVGIEVMPVGALLDAGADAGLDLHQPLAGKAFHRFANDGAADAELFHQIGLVRQRGAYRVTSTDDAATKLVDEIAEDAATGDRTVFSHKGIEW